MQNLDETSFLIAGRRIDPLAGVVTHAGIASPLPAKAMQVLLTLAAQPGKTVSRRTLIDEHWRANDLVGQKGVSHAIWQIRRALADNNKEHLVRTVPREGYCLRSDVFETILQAEFDKALVVAIARPGFWKRRPNVAAVAASVVFAITMLGFLLPSGWRQAPTSPPPEPSSVTPSLSVTSDNWRSNPVFSDVRNEMVYQKLIDGQFDIILRKLDDGSEVNLTHSPDHLETWPAFSPDGTLLAYWSRGAERCVLRVQTLETGEKRDLNDNPPDLRDGAIAFSPDGRYLASPLQIHNNGQIGLALHDLETGDWKRISYIPDTTLSDKQPAFSPDGTRIALIRSSRDGFSALLIIDIETGTETIVPTQGLSPFDVVWDKTGSALYLTVDWNEQALLVRLNPESGQLTTYDFTDVSSIAREGENLVVTQTKKVREYWMIDLSDPEPERLPLSATQDNSGYHDRNAGLVSFTTLTVPSRDDHSEIATTLWTGPGLNTSQPIISVKDGRFWRSSIGPGGELVAAIWSSPSHQAGTLVNTRTGQVTWLDPGDEGRLQDIAFSPDGKWLYFMANPSGAWELWRQELGIARPPQELTRFGIKDFEVSKTDGRVYVQHHNALYELKENGEANRLLPDDNFYYGMWTVTHEGVLAIRWTNVNDSVVLWMHQWDGTITKIADLTRAERIWQEISYDPNDQTLVYATMGKINSRLDVLDSTTLPIVDWKLIDTAESAIPARPGDCVHKLWPKLGSMAEGSCVKHWLAGE